MKGLYLIISIAFIASSLSIGLYGEVSDTSVVSRNQVVAIVNSEVITLMEVLREMPQQQPDHISDQEWLMLRFQYFRLKLNSIVERNLLVQEAKSIGIEILQDALDQEVKRRWAGQFDSKEMFLEQLKKMKMSYKEFKEQVENKLLSQSIIRRRIQFDNTISPKALVDHYRKNIEDFTVMEKRKLRIIQIPVELESGEDPILLADSLVKRLKNDRAKFASLARTYSKGPGAAEGGSWGWKEPRGMLKEIRQVAFKLEKGNISDVIPTQVGYFILMVEAIKSGEILPFEEAQVSIRQIIQNQRYKEDEKKLLNELKNRSYVVHFLPLPEMIQ